MVIAEQRVAEGVVIEQFMGRFDQTARREYKWRVDMAMNAGYRHVILDLTGVSFIDSTALGWLVLSQRRLQAMGGKLSIVARPGFVRDILALTEIPEWIPVFPTREEALAVVTKTPEQA